MRGCDYNVFLSLQMGAYHTIELEVNRKFTLAKKSWDSVVLDRIGEQLLLLNFIFFHCCGLFDLIHPS